LGLVFFLCSTALSLGFRFFNEEGRTRWQNGDLFEMYRDAVVSVFV
jgi:hypothetical protein